MNKQLIAAVLAILSTISGITYYNLNGTQAMDILATTPSDAEIYSQWTTWVAKYGKQYKTEEVPLKYQAFADNYRYIVATNAKQLSYKVGLNQFSDLTNPEFSALQKGQIQLNSKIEKRYVTLKTDTLPASVDWVSQGAVTAIKNQGQCGSCWSFSTTGGLEGLNFISTGTLLSFSEQQLVDCSGSYGNQGCNGGLPDQAYQYTAAQGIEQESTYPYTGQDGTCAYSQSSATTVNSNYQDVTVNSPTQLQAAVAQQPTSVLIEADQPCFQNYASGILNDASCFSEGQIDHAVLAVGYGSQGGDNYWIVKNSWGTSWGLNGYVWIYFDPSANDSGMCGINTGPSYPTA